MNVNNMMLEFHTLRFKGIVVKHCCTFHLIYTFLCTGTNERWNDFPKEIFCMQFRAKVRELADHKGRLVKV